MSDNSSPASVGASPHPPTSGVKRLRVDAEASVPPAVIATKRATGPLRGCAIVMTGPSCSGKGTQSRLLAEWLHVPAVSTGDLLRAEAASGSDVGRAAAEHMNRGDLVPVDLLHSVMTRAFARPEYADGVIVDGCFRDDASRREFESIFADVSLRVLCVVHLEPTYDVLVARMRGRARTSGRADDDVCVFEHKYRVYTVKTVPVVNDFRRAQKCVEPVVATDSVEAIQTDIRERLVPHLVRGVGIRAMELFTGPALAGAARVLYEVLLDANAHKRTGLERRVVLLATANGMKHAEFVALLDLYGIECLRLDTSGPAGPDGDWRAIAKAMMAASPPKVTTLALFEEATTIVRAADYEVDDPARHVEVAPADGARVTNCSVLRVTDPKGAVHTYTQKVRGRFDFARATVTRVFGWDDVFVVDGADMTFQHMSRCYGIKASPRANNVAAWLEQRVYYKELANFKDNPVPMTRPIDFAAVFQDAIAAIPQIRGAPGLTNLITAVGNSGIVLKAAGNRRQKGLWCPGLNGGLPLTPKDNDVHEIAFFLHDTCHFAIPDLVFTGVDSEMQMKIYVIWRMMSEALTLIMADMLAIDWIARLPGYGDYDFAKRAIYPLFLALGLSLNFADRATFMANLRAILHANFRYCLFGDDGPYREMLARAGSSTEALDRFKAKYEVFFVGDYEWTIANYRNMAEHADVIRHWYASVRGLCPLRTISDVEAEVGEAADLPQAVFDYIFERLIVPAFETTEADPVPHTVARAFAKYMAGQMVIFSKFAFVSYARKFADSVKDGVRSLFDLDEDTPLSDVLAIIDNVRANYEAFLARLAADSFITQDDLKTFKETCPLFDAKYLTFKTGTSTTIKAVADAFFQSKMTHADAMHALVRAGNGIVDRDHGGALRYVFRPGVVIMAEHPGADAPEIPVTVLVAGCLAATMARFGASAEARVLRIPGDESDGFYRTHSEVERRVQDVRVQKAFIRDMCAVRAQWRGANMPDRIYHEAAPGLKTVAFLCTMRLRDWHAFFARSMASLNGDDSDYVETKCHQLLRAKFPSSIRAIEHYAIRREDPAPPPVSVSGVSQLPTPECLALCKSLGVASRYPVGHMLASLLRRFSDLKLEDVSKE